MRKSFISAVAAAALILVAVAPAGADPTRHFTGSFAINCGGVEHVIVEKAGSSNVLTVNGAPSNAVSVLFRLVVTTPEGTTTEVDKPLPKTGHVQICTGEFEPGVAFTAWTLITPG
jgi:hypothetical protein